MPVSLPQGLAVPTSEVQGGEGALPRAQAWAIGNPGTQPDVGTARNRAPQGAEPTAGQPQASRERQGQGRGPAAAGGAPRTRTHTTLSRHGERAGCAHSTWGGCGQAEARERTGVSSETASKRVDVSWTDTAAPRGRQLSPPNTPGQGREPLHPPPLERQSRPPTSPATETPEVHP